MANGNNTAIVPNSAVISRLPWGLLDAHGLKNGGAYPRNIESNVQVVWDELGLLLANYHEYLAPVITTVNAAGFTVFAQVPPGEVWYMDTASTTVVSGVGEAWVGYIGLVNPQNTAGVALSTTLSFGASVTQTIVAANRGHWLGIGDQLGLVTHTVTGTVDITMQARILRFRM